MASAHPDTFDYRSNDIKDQSSARSKLRPRYRTLRQARREFIQPRTHIRHELPEQFGVGTCKGAREIPGCVLLTELADRPKHLPRPCCAHRVRMSPCPFGRWARGEGDSLSPRKRVGARALAP